MIRPITGELLALPCRKHQPLGRSRWIIVMIGTGILGCQRDDYNLMLPRFPPHKRLWPRDSGPEVITNEASRDAHGSNWGS